MCLLPPDAVFWLVGGGLTDYACLYNNIRVLASPQGHFGDFMSVGLLGSSQCKQQPYVVSNKKVVVYIESYLMSPRTLKSPKSHYGYC